MPRCNILKRLCLHDLFHSVTSNHTSAWRPEPVSRGTYGLLSNCIITLGLCVWTGVHPNVPGSRRTYLRIWQKVKWLLIGLLAPEILVYVAWRQYRVAKEVSAKMQAEMISETDESRQEHGLIKRLWRRVARVRAQPDEIEANIQLEELEANSGQYLPTTDRHPWTLTHGFYVTMGAYAMDTGKERFLGASHKRATLTAEGLLFLLRHDPDLVPNLSKRDILDKSKQNALAKTIVCIQGLWFCMQCVARVSQSIPLSLLELNTFTHVICAFLTYALWWNKPLDVEEPTLIQGENMNAICAYMWMASYASYIHGGSGNSEFESIHYRPPDEETESAVMDEIEGSSEPINVTPTVSLKATGFFANPDSPRFRPRKKVTTYRRDPYTYRMRKRERWRTYTIEPVIKLYPDDVARWRLASQGLKQYSGLSKPTENLDLLLESLVNDLVTIPDPFVGKPIELWSFWGVALAGVFYGGFHLLAWNVKLPLASQETMWRFSAMSVTVYGVAVAVVATAAALERITEQFESIRHFLWLFIRSLYGLFVLLIMYCAMMYFPVYVVARVYLVVESFVQVFYIPVEVYEMPSWARYIPHLS